MLAGRPDQALERLGSSSAASGFAAARERLCLATIRFRLGQRAAAEDLLEPLLRPGNEDRETAVAAQLLRAAVAERHHRDSVALEAVTAAIELACPDDIRAPFLFTEAPVAHLLERYGHLGGRHVAFARGLAVQIAPEGPAAPEPVLVDRLTERETAVLQYLPTLLKTHEIADDLHLSVNTIKAHLRSIYHKLGTSTRRQAVERARTQRLL